jgi:hypothetical protein
MLDGGRMEMPMTMMENWRWTPRMTVVMVVLLVLGHHGMMTDELFTVYLRWDSRNDHAISRHTNYR